MAKKVSSVQETVEPTVQEPSPFVQASGNAQPPQVPDVLVPEDLRVFEISLSNNKLARLTAEKAIAEANSADANHRYIMLQIFVKYGLTAQDAISEQGAIVRGGAVQKQG
jgi:hypothetical protein